MALEEERRAAEELRGTMTVLERKRIALQTELEDVRGLLEAVSLSPLDTASDISAVLLSRGKSLSSRLRILEDQFTSPLCMISDHIKSINSVTATMHEDTVKNGLLTDQ